MPKSERFQIIKLGDKHQEKPLVKLGYTTKLIDMTGDPGDGGPVSLCVCANVAAAERIRNALELAEKL